MIILIAVLTLCVFAGVSITVARRKTRTIIRSVEPADEDLLDEEDEDIIALFVKDRDPNKSFQLNAQELKGFIKLGKLTVA